MRQRSVQQLAQAILKAKQDGVGVCLLFGAGVSKTAGIPTAAGFVQYIHENYPENYKEAQADKGGETPGYAEAMAALTDGERRRLVKKHVEAATINWAHIAIALMEEQGFADRFLTVNFDPILSRACALLNRFPAVYDFAALPREPDGRSSFKPDFVEGSAIYHLHGQHTGFVLLNTQEKMAQQAASIGPVLQDAVKDRIVIVCGYSGDNDPLLDELYKASSFPNGLYWFCRSTEAPGRDAHDRLLSKIDDAFIVRDEDADTFFTNLTRKLGIFPPKFIANPFEHTERVLATVNPFTVSDSTYDILDAMRQRLQWAKERDHERNPDIDEATELLGQGAYRAVYERFGDLAADPDAPVELKYIVSTACVEHARTLAEEATLVEPPDDPANPPDYEFYFSKAVRIAPNFAPILNDRGSLYLNLAKNCWEKESAIRLLDRAIEQFKKAIKIDPHHYNRYYNLGTAYLESSQYRSREESAQDMFDHAETHLQKAIEINSEQFEAWGALGNLYTQRAEQTSEVERRRTLLEEAILYYKNSIEINPDESRTFNNIGITLLHLSDQSSDELYRYDCLREAETYLQRAEDIAPGAAAYNLACLAVRRQQLAEARSWLETAEAYGQLPTTEHLESDTDMDPLRDDEWFQDLVARNEPSDPKSSGG